ncbi:MAG: helix-turn-helix domain containing protein [Proteobacteria bacterium]|nr:helix-turn-helix domain containing protein [Pseudomonadota bacterium]
MNSQPDGQRNRSTATQQALKLATEKLIAEKGLANVTIREIVREAGQRNESALQYHFRNFQGLIAAIQASRKEETQAKREELLDNLLKETEHPSLRDLCALMVMPTYLLAKASPEYRRFVVGFSHEIALTTESALALVTRHGAGGRSGQELGELLRRTLTHLNEPAYRQRMDSAIRLASISMGHHARQRNAFRGQRGDYFVSSLIDALVGLLSAPVSAETAAVAP